MYVSPEGAVVELSAITSADPVDKPAYLVAPPKRLDPETEVSEDVYPHPVPDHVVGDVHVPAYMEMLLLADAKTPDAFWSI